MDVMALPRPVGFVLGGGGSLGAIQVGMLQALAEQGITPDLAVGTSVGSINGAVVARDPNSAANRLSHAWSRTTRKQVFPGGLQRLRVVAQEIRQDGRPMLETSGRRCWASPVLQLRQPNSCRGRAVMHRRTIQLLDGSIRSPKALICP